MTTQSQRAGTTVLIVEDDFLVRDCTAEALAEAGFEVLQATTGPEALEILEEARVDALFTDINMPGDFDGLELAQRVRHRWPHIAIVITSGRGSPEGQVDGARFVPKPYLPESVACLIAEAVGLRGLRGKLCAPSKLGRLAG
jgi:two-component system, response regulator PdtaR